MLAEQLREVVEVGVLQRGLGRHAPRGLVAQHLAQQLRAPGLQAGHHLPCRVRVSEGLGFKLDSDPRTLSL